MTRPTTYCVCIGAPWAMEVNQRLRLHETPQRLFVGLRHQSIANIRLDPLEMSLHRWKPRYAFFLNWSEKVGPEVTEQFECVNFHCTDLPYGRGGNPIENLLLRGHTETVITAHRMTQQIDAGPVYYKFGGVSLLGSKAEILRRFVSPCAELALRIVVNTPEPRPQDGTPTYFRRLTPTDYQAVWAGRMLGGKNAAH